MRRYLRCPGAICCPARRALRAVLQPHIRFCDELIVVDRAEHVGELLGLVSERLGSVLKHRLQHGEHRQGDPHLLALFRLRSTGPRRRRRRCDSLLPWSASTTGVASKPERANPSASEAAREPGSDALSRDLEKIECGQNRLPGASFFTR